MLQNYAFGTRLLIYLVINFGVLALGGLLQGAGPAGEWYQNLNKAPWTPPGWVFGASWTLIMILLSFFMANITTSVKYVYVLFVLQLILNMSWNPTFFIFNQIVLGIVILMLLSIVVLFMMIVTFDSLHMKAYLLVPYFIWLCIATSLNLYVVLYN